MNIDFKSIDIVIATYNGESYIAEQIQSIIEMNGFESYINNIIICDDNSKDNTLEIIESLVPSEKLVILQNSNDHTNLGPIKNFERGVLKSQAAFVMLSDQDDVWKKEKLELYIQKIKEIDKNVPFVIFSDLEVVDEKLKTICSSFLEYQSIPKNWHENINNLLIQNTAPGCTMLFNRELVKEAFPLPEKCIMHDWWLILVAKVLGDVYFINEALIKYRQHGKNQVGAKRNGLKNILIGLGRNSALARKNLHKTLTQMNDLNQHFPEHLSTNTKERIINWNLCFNSDVSIYSRFYKTLSCGLKKSSPIKTLGLYYLIFTGKK